MDFESRYITLNTPQEKELQLHYLVSQPSEPEKATQPPALLLHGFPTSAWLWRKMLPTLGQHRQVIALDLPGFGKSGKPLDISYSFRCYERVIDAFVEELGLGPVHLVVHDLGGPVGLYWAIHHPQKVKSLALFNTLFLEKLSTAVIAFMVALRTPGLRRFLTSQRGITSGLRFGLADKRNLSDEDLEPYLAPFRDKKARQALIKAALNLHPKGLQEIEQTLPTMPYPIRGFYGEKDWILPTIAKDFRTLQTRIPSLEVTSFPNAGHFLQEEIPNELSEGLQTFWR